MSIDYHAFDALTFDCYGTLIDWESGMLAAMRAAMPGTASIGDDLLLETFGRYETGAQHPYQKYRDVLASTLRSVSSELGIAVSAGAVERFSASVGDWPAFPDSSGALRRLKARYKLGVITNCDTDLFAMSNRRLGVEFDWIITAEMAGSYKPDIHNFNVAFATISVPRERILHVAQSLFHDHEPAKSLGMTTVWIDRRHERSGFGATPPASVEPDARFISMEAFADAATST
ncbi:MAG: haloacid dehalogenase type II [Thermomicrobiales bacterium]|nr:haloacid dehalogenase type II [Thermomicrobiales bacterium]